MKYPYPGSQHINAVMGSAYMVQMLSLFLCRGFYAKHRVYFIGGVHLAQLYCEDFGMYSIHQPPINEFYVNKMSWPLTLVYAINMALHSVTRCIPFRVKLFMQLLTVAVVMNALMSAKAMAWQSASSLYGTSDPLLLSTCFRALEAALNPALWLSPWFPHIPASSGDDGCPLRQVCRVTCVVVIMFAGVLPLAWAYHWEMRLKLEFFRRRPPGDGAGEEQQCVLAVRHLWSVKTLFGVWLFLCAAWNRLLPDFCSTKMACDVSGP